MADTVTLTIDGKPVSVPKGTLIVDAAKRIQNDIPVFCYHPKMKPVGMCRMCLVDVGRVQRDRATGQPVLDDTGQPKIAFGPKLETACTTPVEEGMVVVGASQKVTEARDDVIEFILTSHPLDCPICDKGGECPLQNLTMRHGPGQSRFIFDEKLKNDKHVPLGTPDNALIYLDRERCIQCARCTRFCDEVADDHVLGFYERGRKLEIVTFSDPGFDSKFSGNTTDICPVGALTTADFRFGARPWELTPAASLCNHCPVGCNTTLSTRREAKAGGRPVVKRVMPRQNEQVNEIWLCDKGRFGYHFTESPDRLKTPLIRKNGQLTEATWDEALTLVADKLRAAGARTTALVGGRLANEDLFNIQRVLTHLGGHVELNERMGGGALTEQVGVGVGTNFKDLGAGDVVVVVASDLEEEAPLWWLRLKQAAERGATLIVAHGRATKTDRAARHSLRYAYGQEVATVLGWLVADASPAAQAIHAARNLIILYGREGLDLAGSAALAQACANVLIATGHYGRANNGLLAVWPHANSQGARALGIEPALRPLSDTLAAANAAWIVAADPLGDGTVTSLPAFTVVQDLFLTETAQRAEVVLPAAAWTERDGTYTNGERRVQRFYPAVPAQAKSDVEIAALVGEKLGLKLSKFASVVFNDIARAVPAYAGLNYQKLAEAPKQWPDVGGADLYYGGTSYTNDQGIGVQTPTAAERGEAVSARPVDVPATPTANLILVPVSVLYDRGTTFGRSVLMHPRLPLPHVELNAADAHALGIANGDTVTVSAGGRDLTVTAHVNGKAPQGVALLPESLTVPTPEGATPATLRKA